MTTPFFQHAQPIPKSCEAQGNRGLWFERFYDQYDQNWAILKPTNNNQGNTHWLQKHFGNKQVGNEQQLKQHSIAQSSLIGSLGGKTRIFKASWHLVSGMGNPHPVENGFAWHPTLGVPFLTGAAVKGLLRSHIETHLDASDAELKALLFQWFGSTDKDPLKAGYISQAGALVFFDAIPIQPVHLTVDIMTPHMGKWYEKGGSDVSVGHPDAVPADWHDPVPVTYLAAKSISMQFSFALRTCPQSNSTSPSIELDDVFDALQHALKQSGAGGKTAVGYGAMEIDSDAEELQRVAVQQALLAALREEMTAAQRKIRDFIDYMQKRFEELRHKPTRENGVEHQKARDLAKIAHESSDWTEDDKRDAADAIIEWLPRVVTIPKMKDEAKKLKLSQLKGDA